MATNDFKPFATNNGANVTGQTDWESLPALSSGFTAGVASSAQINKALRQSSSVTAALTDLIASTLNSNVADDGNISALTDKIKNTLLAVGSGRLINMRIFTISGVYTPTEGTKKIIVEVQGGGGGGGGVSLGASATSNAAAAAGGTAGCYARARLDVPVGNVTVTIGAGGLGGAGSNNGGGGGLTSFGTQVSAGGGYGGTTMTADSVPAIVVAAASTQPGGTVPIGGNVNSSTATTQYNFGVRLSGSVANSGSGGCSLFGNGGGGSGVSNTLGGDAASYGAGGGGARASGTAAATFNGGKGGGGVVIVWEFS
ncbi:hypothetical protein ABKT77_23570 [Enterobacter cloacae]|uniref:glycine-rich domain-containing protein n=1 Tax=Enterobacter cloacae TaxID=550 RepID=UPI002002F01D|nr:hypothetical protein [Enterobacter cloacae]MCK6745155.1 hypothetical protein [Enterobacter cloacae]MCK6785131.1 hypothetical protein [Enterobacter cloacae]